MNKIILYYKIFLTIIMFSERVTVAKCHLNVNINDPLRRLVRRLIDDIAIELVDTSLLQMCSGDDQFFNYRSIDIYLKIWQKFDCI